MKRRNPAISWSNFFLEKRLCFKVLAPAPGIECKWSGNRVGKTSKNWRTTASFMCIGLVDTVRVGVFACWLYSGSGRGRAPCKYALTRVLSAGEPQPETRIQPGPSLGNSWGMGRGARSAMGAARSAQQCAIRRECLEISSIGRSLGKRGGVRSWERQGAARSAQRLSLIHI